MPLNPGSCMGNIHTLLLLINTAWGQSRHSFIFGRPCAVVGMIEGLSNLEFGDLGLSHSSASLRVSNLSFQSTFLGMRYDLMK